MKRVVSVFLLIFSFSQYLQSEKVLKNRDDSFHYLYVTKVEKNNINNNFDMTNYQLIYKKKSSDYTFILLKNLYRNYSIQWHSTHDSIYITYYFQNKASVEKYRYNKPNYIQTLNNLEMFQFLPIALDFNKNLKYLKEHKIDHFTEYVGRSYSGMTYLRKNRETQQYDSLTWCYGDDIQYFSNFSIKYIPVNQKKETIDSIISSIQETSVLQSNDADTLDYRSFLTPLFKNRKYLILDFWFVHCSPCRKSMAILNTLKDSALYNVVALNPIDDTTTINNFRTNSIFNISLISCPPKLVNHFNVHSYPTTLILDSNFNILLFEEGFNPNLAMKINSTIY